MHTSTLLYLCEFDLCDVPDLYKHQEEQLWWRSQSTPPRPGGKCSVRQNTDWSLQHWEGKKKGFIVVHYVKASISNSIIQAEHTVYFTFNIMLATQRPSLGAQTLLLLLNPFLTKVYISLCDEPGLVVGIQGERVGHQLCDRHSHGLHIYCLNAASHKCTSICDAQNSQTVSSRWHHHSYFGIEEGQMERCSAVTSFTMSSWRRRHSSGKLQQETCQFIRLWDHLSAKRPMGRSKNILAQCCVTSQTVRSGSSTPEVPKNKITSVYLCNQQWTIDKNRTSIVI